MSTGTRKRRESLNESISKMLCDGSIPAKDRGDMLLFQAAECGLDFRPAVQALIEEADEGRKFKAKYEEQPDATLVTERFVERVPSLAGGAYAVVTRGPADVCIPANNDVVEKLRMGDTVLVNKETERIVGMDGQIATGGEIVATVTRVGTDANHVYLRYEGREVHARIHHSLCAQPDLCQPEREVLYDPLRRFALHPVTTQSDGTELLFDVDQLQRMDREHVGACKPVVDEIIARVRQFIDHPEWIEKMGVRDALFVLVLRTDGRWQKPSFEADHLGIPQPGRSGYRSPHESPGDVGRLALLEPVFRRNRTAD